MEKTIENIFSSRKEKTEKGISTVITLDLREKQSLVAANLIKNRAKINFETLEIADYLIGDVAIERKTFKDFQSSIIDRRLMEQLGQLKKYEKRILILEGFCYNYQNHRINENAIRGAMLAVALSFNTPMIFSKDEEDSAKFLISIAKKQDRIKEKNNREYSIRPMKTADRLEEQKQYVLEGFPGIGPALAKKLIASNKNILSIFKAEKKDLKEDNILDEKTIDKMKEILER